MGIFDGYLIGVDFDGTLTGSDGSIPQSNISAICEYISEGGLFTVVTGRTFQGFHVYREDIINAPVIMCNGSLAYDYKNGKPAFYNGLTAETSDFIDYLITEHPNVSTELYGLGFTFAANINENSYRHLACQDIIYNEVCSSSEITFPLAKIMLNGKHGELEKIAEKSREYPFLGYIDGFNEWMEIVTAGTNKAQGLLCLASQLGVSTEKICCAGDGYNDCDMLSAFRNSFAPSSGCESAIKAAAYTTCSADDGAIAGMIEMLREIIKR